MSIQTQWDTGHSYGAHNNPHDWRPYECSRATKTIPGTNILSGQLVFVWKHVTFNEFLVTLDDGRSGGPFVSLHYSMVNFSCVYAVDQVTGYFAYSQGWPDYIWPCGTKAIDLSVFNSKGTPVHPSKPNTIQFNSPSLLVARKQVQWHPATGLSTQQQKLGNYIPYIRGIVKLYVVGQKIIPTGALVHIWKDQKLGYYTMTWEDSDGKAWTAWHGYYPQEFRDIKQTKDVPDWPNYIWPDGSLSIGVDGTVVPTPGTITAPSKPKGPTPELPAECWREAHGLTRKGVDFQAITRLIAESSKSKG